MKSRILISPSDVFVFQGLLDFLSLEGAVCGRGWVRLRKVWRVLAVLLVTRGCGAEGEHEGEARVMTFQSGMWRPSNNYTFVRYNFSLLGLKPLPEFSVCYWVRLEAMADLNIHVSYATAEDNSNAILVYSSETRLKAWYNRRLQSLTMARLFEAFPGAWYHLCHSFSRHTYSIYLQGQVLDPTASDKKQLLLQKYLTGEILGDGGPLLTNGTLILGQEQDGVSQGFDPNQVLMGELAQVSFWDRVVTLEEVRTMASCRSSGRPTVFSSDTANMEFFGDVTEKWVHLSHLCRYVFLPETRSITDASRQCFLTNASLALPTSTEENQLLLDALHGFVDVCAVTNVRKLWLGSSDEVVEGNWRIDGTGGLMVFNRFYPPAPNGGTVNNCLVMRSDGAWEDDICDERNKKCTACFYQDSDFLRLRGLCFDNEHQQRFAVTGYMSGKPMYRGYYNLLIHWNSNNTWYLTDTKTNITIATISFGIATHYPLGRHTWRLHSTVCDTPAGDEIELSLSACDDDQYMCRDGECIPSTERCNLRSDCLDGSDEETCNFLLLPKGYRSYLTPVNPETGEKLALRPHIFLTRFDAIEDISMTVSLELKVSLSWYDNRLTFANLQDSQRPSLISKSDQGSMWLPDYKFENIYRGNIKTLEETVAVERNSNQLKPDFNRLNMDTLFPGTKNSLTQTKKFIGTFTCNFELYFYPFDSQFCEIQLQLSTELKDHAVFSFRQGVAEYIGAKHLPLYTVQGVTLQNHSQAALMSVDFVLKRRSGIAVLTTFVPTVLLLLVSWATLFVKIENLNVRATMALTSLLVLYTMFSNLSRSLPATAEIKLIDVWFFFIIFLIFSNIMVHVFAEYLPLHPQESCIKVTSLTEPRSSSSSKITPARLLKLQRYFFVPFAFLVFSIYFWCTAFMQ